MSSDIDVTKVVGGPGCGKTTTMIGNVGLEMNGLFIDNMDEYGLDEQMMVTYTNSGVDEVIERLYQMTDHYKKDIENRVTTIHSRCWSTLGKNHNNLVNWRNEKAFCEDAGLEYGFEDDDADDAMAGDDENAGNALIQIYGWLKSNRLPLSEHDQYPNTWPGERPLGPLLKAWDRYKEENDLFDYADLIEEVVEMNVDVLRKAELGDTDIDDDVEYLKSVRQDPDALRKKKAMRGNHGFIDTRVLYVDECQDLTKLQWSWYLCQKLVADEVYIGFDEDQTIYGWSGADPRQPLNEEGDVELLEKTYRVPRAVWQVCDSCIRQVEDRHEKDVEPVDEEGEFVSLRNPTGGQLTKHIDEAIQEYDEDVLVLFRARFHIDEFRKQLHSAGIPYDNMSTFQTWGQDLKKLRKPLGKLNQGQPVNPDGVKLLLDEADDDNINGTREGQKANIFGMSMPDDVEEMFNVPGYGNFVTWYVGELDDDDYNWYEREALKHNVLKGKTGYDPDQVRVGTIHSAKGKEAGTVILGTDSTPTIISNMASDVGRDQNVRGPGSAISDDERRVMYVGMSRASRKLVMAEGAVTNDAKLKINALVNGDDDK